MSLHSLEAQCGLGERYAILLPRLLAARIPLTMRKLVEAKERVGFRVQTIGRQVEVVELVEQTILIES